MGRYIPLFFTYEDSIPSGAGYELFHAEHVSIMVACLAVIIALIYAYRRLDNDGRTMMRRTIAFSEVGLIVARMTYVLLCHADIKYELPLHLCSIAGMLCLLYEWRRDKVTEMLRSAMEQALFSLCLPGALMAIVFSDGTRYPAVHFITIQSNLYHALVVAYIVVLLVDGGIHPNIREAYKGIVFLAVIVPLVYAADRVLGANYMFLVKPSYGSPFAFVYVTYGYMGYMICYALTVLIEIYAINIVGMVIIRSLAGTSL